MKKLIVCLLTIISSHGMAMKVVTKSEFDTDQAREALINAFGKPLNRLNETLKTISNGDMRAFVLKEASYILADEENRIIAEIVANLKGYNYVLEAIKCLENPFEQLCRAYAPFEYKCSDKVLNPLYLEECKRPESSNYGKANELCSFLQSPEAEKVNINVPLGPNKATLLKIAAENNAEFLVACLLKLKADLKNDEPSYNALLRAIDNAGDNKGNVAITERLLEAGADPNSREGCFQYTALMMAAERLNFAIMELLIRYGANITPRNNHNQETAFEIAIRRLKKAQQNSPETIQKLKTLFAQAKKLCDYCHSPTKSRCSRCHIVYYCSTDCQRKSRKDHIPHCKR